MRTLYLCGAGNAEGVRLAQRVNAAESRWDEILLLDDDRARHGDVLLGVPIVGSIDELSSAPAGAQAANLVARTTAGRAAVRERILASGVPLASLVHPSVDAGECEVAPGALVYEQAILSTATHLGLDSVVFMRAVIGHDATVGAGCVVASGAVLNARVVLEEHVYVGSNASVLPDARVGARSTIAANSMVATAVPEDATVIGVPGQVVSAFGARSARAETTDAPSVAVAAKLEAALVERLRAVLKNPTAGPTDRFFEVGGTSLLALEFIAAIDKELGCQVSLVEFYSRCSVRELTGYFLGGRATEAGAPLAPRAGLLGVLAARRAPRAV